jgi:hypothetical protein
VTRALAARMLCASAMSPWVCDEAAQVRRQCATKGVRPVCRTYLHRLKAVHGAVVPRCVPRSSRMPGQRCAMATRLKDLVA